MSNMLLRRLALLFRGMAGLATRFASFCQKVEVRLSSQTQGAKLPRFYRHGDVLTPVDKRNAEALARKAVELDATVSRSVTYCGEADMVSHLWDASYIADSCSQSGYNLAMLAQAAYDLQHARMAHASAIIERGKAVVDDPEYLARRAFAKTIYLKRLARLLADLSLYSSCSCCDPSIPEAPQTYPDWVAFLEAVRHTEEKEPAPKPMEVQP